MTEPVEPTTPPPPSGSPRADGLPNRVAVAHSERPPLDVARRIVGGLRDEKIKPIGREGTATSHWVLLDFGDVVVHIFTPPERDYYSLEKHWAEAKTVLRVQ